MVKEAKAEVSEANEAKAAVEKKSQEVNDSLRAQEEMSSWSVRCRTLVRVLQRFALDQIASPIDNEDCDKIAEALTTIMPREGYCNAVPRSVSIAPEPSLPPMRRQFVGLCSDKRIRNTLCMAAARCMELAICKRIRIIRKDFEGIAKRLDTPVGPLSSAPDPLLFSIVDWIWSTMQVGKDTLVHILKKHSPDQLSCSGAGAVKRLLLVSDDMVYVDEETGSIHADTKLSVAIQHDNASVSRFSFSENRRTTRSLSESEGDLTVISCRNTLPSFGER
ncbi:hypothetical protein AC578_6810 [Pseudocercospora eumusae]|uniref:Uncharacterized protein n=1 Tax=Pseudocercospora eumusae TaxID=321146 RepID=A0A139GW89_9PEZI|nr:hypothetical protein AC578_6810 [Pseudocercospora eumusae]